MSGFPKFPKPGHILAARGPYCHASWSCVCHVAYSGRHATETVPLATFDSHKPKCIISNFKHAPDDLSNRGLLSSTKPESNLSSGQDTRPWYIQLRYKATVQYCINTSSCSCNTFPPTQIVPLIFVLTRMTAMVETRASLFLGTTTASTILTFIVVSARIGYRWRKRCLINSDYLIMMAMVWNPTCLCAEA